MAIQWFPGHMHKARKEIAHTVQATDVIMEVLDARLPWSSENPMLEELCEGLPRLKVLAKADLADEQRTTEWVTHIESATVSAVALDMRERNAPGNLPSLIKSRFSLTASPTKPRVILVVGIPNVGKSTLINALVGSKVAKTGNEPAITRRQQRIPLAGHDHWFLCDTPGVLWPNLDNPSGAIRLAATGAVRDTAMDSAEVAAELIDMMGTNYRDLLVARYGETAGAEDGVAALEAIGFSSGCIGGGGLVDFDRAGRLLLSDFRSGRLGRMTLETPASKHHEEILMVATREAAAAKKAERQARRKKRKQRG